MSTNDLQIFGLEESAKLSIKEVHNTYHALAREYHPDKNIAAPDEATAKFQAIQGAYAAILKGYTLHDIDGEAGTPSNTKLAKPWAAKRGRKFNHRAMQEVENLKINVAKAAAQRAVDKVVRQEQAERPKEKKRAKQWEKAMRKAEIAAAREKEAARKLEARLAQKAESLRNKGEEKKSSNRTPQNESHEKKETEASLFHQQQTSLILSPAGNLTSYLNQKADAIIDTPEVGRNKPDIIQHLRAEQTAHVDSETSKLETAEDMQFEIPNEFKHSSSDLYPEDDPENNPELFIEQFNTPDNPNFAKSFLQQFPEFTDLAEESGDDFGKIFKEIKQQKEERRVEKEKESLREEEENKKKVAAFEKYWASKKTVKEATPVATVPKKERVQGLKGEKKEREFNQAHLANLVLHSSSDDEEETNIPAIEQETLAPTRWNKSAVVGHLIENGPEEEEGDEEDEEGNIQENIPEYLWEQETFSQFSQNQDEVNEVLRAWDLRRSQALITALEYQAGMLLEAGSN